MDKLNQYRDKIDKIDAKILELLVDRFEVVKQVGEYKKQNNLPVLDREREQQLVSKKIIASKLEAGFIRSLYKLIFNYSYKFEK